MVLLRKYFKYIHCFVVLFVLLNITSIPAEEILFYIISLVLIWIFLKIKAFNKSFTSYVICLSHIVIGIYQPIDSINNINVYADSIRTSIYVIMNQNYRTKYLFYELTFFVVICVTIIFFDVVVPRSKIMIKLPAKFARQSNFISERYIYIFAMLWSAIRLFVQLRFNILIAGVSATIAHSGIIVYAIIVISLYLFAVGLESIMSDNRSFKSKLTCSIFLSLICSFPMVYVGSRSEELILLLVILIYILLSNDTMRMNYKKIIKSAGIIAVIGLASIYIAYFYRTGFTTNPLTFLAMRFTGMVDGINIVRYIDGGGMTLPVINFFKSLIFADDTVYLGSYYTHVICGYPSELNHSWALPCFASGMLYGGYMGLVIFTIVLGIVLLVVENKIRQTLSEGKKVNCFIYIDLYINIIFICVLEGGIDKASKHIVISFLTLIMDSFIGVRFRSNRAERALMVKNE